MALVTVKVLEATGLLPMDRTGKSDPFVVLRFNKDKKSKRITSIKNQTLEPVWNEEFQFLSYEPQTDKIKFACWDYDKYSLNDFLGQCSVPILAAVQNPIDQWFTLLDKKAESKQKTKKERGKIHLLIEVELNKKTSEETKEKKPEEALERWKINYDDLHLEKELGRGAFGVVYRGKWRLQDVAVKLLPREKMSQKEIEEFRQECTLMMNLRPHRNVIPLLGVCLEPMICIVTDFIEYGSLERLIKSNFMITWVFVLNVMKGVCAGVYHLHKESILHRDLAARNILLRPTTFEPIIADFGLSKKVNILNLPEKEKENIKTKEDPSFRGPYKWMPPESLKNNEFSVKSDSYSFGVVLYEVITRQEPFPHLDIYQAAHQVAECGVRLPIPPNCPSKFARLMSWCWETRPEDRPDFQQISNSLLEIEKEVQRY